jgi:arylsulfatase A-like enzyme
MMRLLILGFALAMIGCGSSVAPSPPNIVIFLADDMGFGDLASYGHPTHRTPNIDRIAAQGVRLTSFVTAVGCVPSRTQLLIGRYMPRVAFNGSTGADGLGGLPDQEFTLAEALKGVGYRTHIIGKWHLGYAEPEFLPVNQGFDTWFGLPYSNDYRKPWVETDEPLGLFRGTEMVEYPLQQDTLTARYTNEAVALIEARDDHPFFIYLAYNMPHLPLHVGERFRGTAYSGLYGDVIQELDWSVGEVLDALRRNGLDRNTIVLFTSDNGPWINPPSRMLQAGNKPWHVGSAGPLRGSKGTSYEGGARVPAILRWPDQIPAGWTSPELIAMPDIYLTLLAIAGAEAPSERILDGYDATQFLRGVVDQSPRSEYFYFLQRLEAVRVGDWKLRAVDGAVELFNLRLDPSEHVNRAEEKPEIVSRLKERMGEMAKDLDYGLAF